MSPKRKAAETPRRIVVGLDFGTTHSGIAWAATKDDMVVISEWPSYSPFNTDKKKVPSTLLYRPGGEEPLWGYDIAPDEIPLTWFKLLLLDDEDLPNHVRNSDHLQQAKLLLQRSNRHVVEIIGDYIKLLWTFGMQDMEREMGRGQLSATQLQLMVTVPAIWPLYARNRMQQAIQHAGIMSLRPAGSVRLGFVSEPEAAAVAAMHDFSGRISVQRNDHFVVCDAGGGTVVTFHPFLALSSLSAFSLFLFG
ncbi:hypothetical protein XA68_10758 [Ophiocordyceps unilateralis]|uniref:Uncharacterized protein n=1 Tax=Ophiocordyceps unilateralis TaxID=268505 RepID=A0A2A9P2G9_OPHUN|nr:hypothetical protein XA68_10758 [Ophiocordyceps unilateralis]